MAENPVTSLGCAGETRVVDVDADLSWAGCNPRVTKDDVSHLSRLIGHSPRALFLVDTLSEKCGVHVPQRAGVPTESKTCWGFAGDAHARHAHTHTHSLTLEKFFVRKTVF